MQHFIERISSKAPQSATVDTISSVVLAANPGRRYATLINDSDEVIYLALYDTAEMNKGIRLNAEGGSYEISFVNAYTGPISAISSASANLCMYEG
jgi:hypothetical protein